MVRVLGVDGLLLYGAAWAAEGISLLPRGLRTCEQSFQLVGVHVVTLVRHGADWRHHSARTYPSGLLFAESRLREAFVGLLCT